MKLSVVGMIAALTAATTVGAHADTFTMKSPSGGTLPSAVSAVGGVVTDLVGKNGTRVVAQVPASGEFIGDETGSAVPTYLTFAQQSGITASVMSALGGGLSSASFRVSLYDGDSQSGNFDFGENFLYVGTTGGTIGQFDVSSTGVNVGSFSDVTTEQTDGMGNSLGLGMTSGFGDNILDTGFFSVTGSSGLSGLYKALQAVAGGSGMLDFQLRDNTPGDQYFDFKQGLDATVINVGTGPVVTGPTGPTSPTGVTPEPSSVLLLGTGMMGLVGGVRRRLFARD